MDDEAVTRLEIFKTMVSNMDESFDETPTKVLAACEKYYRWVAGIPAPTPPPAEQPPT